MESGEAASEFQQSESNNSALTTTTTVIGDNYLHPITTGTLTLTDDVYSQLATTDIVKDNVYSYIIPTTNLSDTDHSERQQQLNGNEQPDQLLGEAITTSNEDSPGLSVYLDLVESDNICHDDHCAGPSDFTGRGVGSDGVTNHGVGSSDDAMVSETYMTVIGDDELLPPAPAFEAEG